MRFPAILSAIICSLLLSTTSKATHIVGGNLNYTYLGGYNYEIRLVVFRDCYTGVPPFDQPALLGIWDSNNNWLDIDGSASSYELAYLGLDTLELTINTPCILPPIDVCYEVTEYIDTLYLPPIPGGYQLAYQRCCRNASIDNLLPNPAVDDWGGTYYAVIPDTADFEINSNPRFNDWTPAFICLGQPFSFDHSATDADGDSLVYELCTPLHGGSSAGGGGAIPKPHEGFFDPPFGPVAFAPGYSANDPLGGIPPMAIDPITGLLTANPPMVGQYVYGVCVKEYRNGILVGQTIRDFQINVTNCPQVVVSSIQSPTTACGDLNAYFTNNSTGAAYYEWDFGDLTTINDTSTVAEPTYTYPDTGHYIVTLIATSDIDSTCADTSTGDVYIVPEFSVDFTDTLAFCDSIVYFYDLPSTLSGPVITWNWDFGDFSGSTLEDPVHEYTQSGTYTVELIAITLYNCEDTMTHNVTILDEPDPSFTFNSVCLGDTVPFIDQSTIEGGSIVGWDWDFGDITTSTDTNPTHIYSGSGIFNVSLVTTSDLGCVDTVTMPVEVFDLPIPGFTDTSVCLNDTTIFTDTSIINSGVITNWYWDFGDTDTSIVQNPEHIYTSPGSYNVTLYVLSDQGCLDSTTRIIDVFPLPVADAGLDDEICFGDSSQLLAGGGVIYLWNPGSFLSDSLIENPMSVPDSTTTYHVIVTDANGCLDEDSVTIVVNALPNADAGPDLWLCPGDSGQITASGGVIYIWSPSTDLSDTTIANPIAGPLDSTTYIVNVTDSNGCRLADTVEVVVGPVVPVNAGPDTSFCLGDSISIGGNPTSPGGSNYAWTPLTTMDDSTLANPTVFPTDTVTYIVYVTNDTCAGFDSVTVIVNPLPVAGFSYQDVCENDTIFFTDSSTVAPGVVASWQWDFDDTNSSVAQSPFHLYDQAGVYNVTLAVMTDQNCLDTSTHTVSVWDLPEPTVESTDVKCYGLDNGTAEVTIAGGTIPYEIFWLPDGQTTNIIANQSPGVYYVSVTDSNNCAKLDSIIITEPTELSYTESSVDVNCSYDCNGIAQVTPLGATSPYTYLWSPGSQNTPTINGLCDGEYEVLITDANGCDTTISITIDYNSLAPLIGTYAAPETVYVGQQTNVYAYSDGDDNFTWQHDSSIDPHLVVSPGIATWYSVVVVDDFGCLARDSVQVFVKEVVCDEPIIFVPSGFTPDLNGRNDQVFVRGDVIDEIYFTIYDRWGEQVFETTDQKIGWGGLFEGALAEPAVFAYYLRVKCWDQQVFFKKGNITLIR